MSAIIPIPRVPVSIRPATMSDYAFIDRLQDMHTKALGFMPKAQLEGKISAGHVLIAETREAVGGEAVKREEDGVTASQIHRVTVLPVGYVMSQDRYFKRDDVGIVYQLNVSPGKQRSLVGAMLMKAVFERAAYGCKLFCCWCAQDLSANYFWEALGFVPLAFRAGARGKRAHIFWQKRIREGDVTTPYWYPCKTDGGHMREDRIVLPIPPGTHWSDAKPMILPPEPLALPAPGGAMKRPKLVRGIDPSKGPIKTVRGQFKPPGQASPGGSVPEPAKEKTPHVKKPKARFDARYLAAARELRDRYLEHLNGEQFNAGTLLTGGKYAVSRAIEAKPADVKLLAA